MDSFTQIALGAAIGDAGFSGKLGGRAVLFGGVCGLLPDLDMFAGLFGDEWTTMVYHRGFSHSLLVLPFVAPLVALVAWRWDGKRSPYLAWLLLAFLVCTIVDCFISPFNIGSLSFNARYIYFIIYTLALLANAIRNIYLPLRGGLRLRP